MAAPGPSVDEGAELGGLRMTPQLREAIRLLTLSRAELAAQIAAEIAAKPGPGSD